MLFQSSLAIHLLAFVSVFVVLPLDVKLIVSYHPTISGYVHVVLCFRRFTICMFNVKCLMFDCTKMKLQYRPQKYKSSPVIIVKIFRDLPFAMCQHAVRIFVPHYLHAIQQGKRIKPPLLNYLYLNYLSK